MRKLTQKEYLEDLQAGSRFIQCCRGVTLEDVKTAVAALECDLKELTTYAYESVQKRSKDFVFTREDGSKAYRDFYGKNEYYTHKQVLYHVNTSSDGQHTCVFVNC